MASDSEVRELLARSLGWSDAHVAFDEAVRDLPAKLRGTRPAGLAHSAWELVEHIRIAQQDILDFCLEPTYKEREWPADYWPASPDPQSDQAWEQSIAAVRADRESLQELACDARIDLMSVTPHGTNQTYLRELLLVMDHTAYHLGQLVVLRKLLEAQKPN